MFLFRYDQRFEEAGRDPELCDKLLKELQRARRSSWISLVALVLILLLAAGWLLIVLKRAILSITNGSGCPPFVDWLLANKGILWVSAGPLILTIATSYVRMVGFDAQIKLLLFLRAQQNRPS